MNMVGQEESYLQHIEMIPYWKEVIQAVVPHLNPFLKHEDNVHPYHYNQAGKLPVFVDCLANFIWTPSQGWDRQDLFQVFIFFILYLAIICNQGIQKGENMQDE